MDTLRKIKDNITLGGAINSLVYLIGCFLLLPIIDKFRKINN